jgi:indole-3-glycerol phosphate synthase
MERSAVDVLSRIADDRRKRVAEMRERVPGHLLRARLGTIRPAGRLERALRRGGPHGPLKLVCEIKRRSPSRGALHPVDDPVAIARLYQAGGATAISIVTEPDHFDGRLEWLDLVRPAVGLPLLLKDFVVDSYQLIDAAMRGADGVLLIAALQSEGQLQRWITEALLLGLDCLVEVHDGDELRRSIRAGATLIGINNRDLRTFQVDLGTSIRLLPSLPSTATAVSESGIAGPEDLAVLRTTRCDAVLMGEVLMTSADPAATLAGLVAAARG